ncbi:MAG: carboxymuconolactone decarboxylase [Streptosporangiaceae bacterium]|jgi:4-carboxymuconolactone decarboxylase|nr:carboxymuconolactone decarboxylase [Streptosporangiaceae bacterium]
MCSAPSSHNLPWVIDDDIDPPGEDLPVRLPLLRPDLLSAEQREVYDAIVDGPRAERPPLFRFADDDGRLLGPFNAMLYSPVVGRPLQELGSALRFRISLTRREREIATLVVAAHWRSDYEWYAHERLGGQAGLTAKEIAALKAGRDPIPPVLRERIVYEVARSMAADQDLSDALYNEAVATLGRPMLVELVTLVSYYGALALQLRVFRMTVPKGEPDVEWEDP